MSWLCSGYSPRRFILATLRGLKIDKRLAKVWKTGRVWRWITLTNAWGVSETYRAAMREAEASIEGSGIR